jgi:pimeloyl-ACP methyl ester carboxylesterase
MAQAGRACRERLTGQGIDLRGYTTQEIAADVVDLRRALGYGSWNLFGVSYSTRSMLAAARADPGGVRSLVLDSFLPAEVNWYDDAVPNLRATIGRLGASWPGLEARFAAMVERLDRTPAVLTTKDPITGAPLTVRLTGDDVATILAEALQQVDVIPIVPALVDGVAQGRTDLLQALADQSGDALTSHTWGEYYAIQCQDEIPFNAFPNQGSPRLFTEVADRTVCADWNLPASPAATAETRSPSGSSGSGAVAMPVLVVGGQYDPTTPPVSARAAAARLPGARFVEFAGVGHAVFLSSWCGRQTISAFVAAPGSPALPCDPAEAAYSIPRPGELRLTSGVYRATTAWWWLLIPGLFAAGSLAQAVGGAATLAWRRSGRSRRRSPEAAGTSTAGVRALLTALAGISGVAFAVLAGLAIYDVAAANQTVLAVGVPAAVTGFALLAVLSALLSVAVAVLSARGPARVRSWLPAAAAAVVAVAFVVWWYAWM